MSNIVPYASLFFVISLLLIGTVIYFTKEGFNTTDDEYTLIKQYLLNESPLYGKNRPKLWIHTTYEVNARKWKSFQDRSSRDLAQPYVECCVQSIIDHCSGDFNILLITDETFSKLIPKWQFGDLSNVPDPKKTNLRQRGLMLLLYYYGGMIVPNSFICMRTLLPMFRVGTTPFCVETTNRTLFSNGVAEFSPSIEFIGINSKLNASLRKFIDECLPWGQIPTDKNDRRYDGDTESKRDWESVGTVEHSVKIRETAAKYVKGGVWDKWGPEYVGLRTGGGDKTIIRLEDLMEESYLDLSPGLFGILIDSAELLKRPKYQWLAVVDRDEETGMLNSAVGNILAKYLRGALVDGMLVASSGSVAGANVI